MAEYIEREELIARLQKVCVTDDTFGMGIQFGTENAINCIKEAPAADVVEVKHGKWEYDPDGNDWGLGAWCCSLCQCKNDNLGMGKHINPYQFAGSKYCPNCGAKMDGDSNV